MKSSLYLKNGVKTNSITVTPILYLSNGVRYSLAPVTLEPSGTAVVDIGQGLASQGIAPYAQLYGYAEIDYQWPWGAVIATIKNVDVVNSLIFIFSLQQSPGVPPQNGMSMGTQTVQTFEGLWWKQEINVSGFLALANLTGQAINATVWTTDSQNIQLASYQISISPHATKMLSLNELQSTASNMGGIYLTYQGAQNTLAINGGLQDNAVGYSAHLWLLPSPPAPSAAASQTPTETKFAELGLMSGAADPMMNFPSGTVFTPYSLVRNTSNQPALVTPTLWWMAGGTPQSAQLPQMTGAPHQTPDLKVPFLMATAGLKNYNGSVNIILDASAQPGALVMTSGSVDQKDTYVFEVLPNAIAESSSKALCYWSTGNGDDTMVTLWNPSDEQQDLVFTLFYTGGHYIYPVPLGPRQTQTFNVSEILQSTSPDAEGNVIPAGVSEGSAEIAGSQGEHQHILVSMDAGTYNVNKAICGVYCQTCNGVSGYDLVFVQFHVALNGTFQETFYETWNSGSQYNYTSSSNWSSSAPAIASVSVGLVSGGSPGAFSITASDPSYENVYISNFCTGGNTPCPTILPSASGMGSVVPVINSILPSSLVIGTTGLMTISGIGFSGKGPPTFQFSGAGISAVNPVVVNDTTIQTGYAVSCSAEPQNITVVFASDGNLKTNAWPLSVVLPAAPMPTIKLAGNNISGAQSVVVGQQIALTTSVSLPGCMTFSNQTWTPPTTGTAVGGYTNAAGNGPPDTTGGQVKALPPNSTTDGLPLGFTFYWTYVGNSLNITYKYTMSGGFGSVNSPLATATFNVAGAGVSAMNAPTGSVGIYSGPVLGYGPVGISFGPTLTTPSADSGEFKWVQLITNDTQTLTTTGGTVKTCVNVTQPATSSGTGLDTGYPYATGTSTKDSPSMGLVSSSYTTEARSFSASMYLLWDPALPAGCTPDSSCTSIPVPLGYVNWGWSGTATYTSGNWSLVSSNKTTPSWNPSNSYPGWSDLVPYNGQISCH